MTRPWYPELTNNPSAIKRFMNQFDQFSMQTFSGHISFGEYSLTSLRCFVFSPPFFALEWPSILILIACVSPLTVKDSLTLEISLVCPSPSSAASLNFAPFSLSRCLSVYTPLYVCWIACMWCCLCIQTTVEGISCLSSLTIRTQ